MLAKDLYERELRPAEHHPRGMALRLVAISEQIDLACSKQMLRDPGENPPPHPVRLLKSLLFSANLLKKLQPLGLSFEVVT